ncbi:MAG: 6-phosphofructokinase [Deltaproteobacteria bacterium]|nr:6-phosphofructokinase [Deltaproteobacteria bacterium]
MARRQRIGVMTAGGDCPGLNAAIRAVALAGHRLHNWEVIGILDGYEGLMKGATMELGPAEARGLLHLGGTRLGSANRMNPFLCRFGAEGEMDCSPLVFKQVEALGLDALIVIGGDGTLTIARMLYDQGLPLVGIPKTIDNDINGTDTSIGFRTAVFIATEALDRLHTTAESHHRVMVLEVMGRNAGWIAAEAGVAGGADVILIPEIPFDLDAVQAKIVDRNASGSRFTIIVVAEGARPKPRASWERPTGPRRIGDAVAEALQAANGLETRVTVLGHLQRGGSPLSFDRILASRFGVAAVELVAREAFGQMVALRGREVRSIPLSEAVATPKLVDPQGELVRTAEALGISFGR